MAFDKAKAVRAAEKHLSQGKIAAAIQEYRRVVDADAKDIAALNTLGDLYARVDKKQEAIDCFTRVAEHYRGQGFALKAIAMYKKIYRLAPGTLDILANLAALYEQQGLMVEARTEYLTIADAMTRSGRTRDALDVLNRVANLDPHNAAVRLRIGEGYEREGFHEEAAAAFTNAGERFTVRGEYEPALEAYERALAIHPHDVLTLSGWLTAHTALGTADDAAETLERAVAARPDDTELLALLARAYTDAENSEAAERTVETLVGRDSTNSALFTDVARLYLKQGDADRAVRALERASESMLAGHDEDELLGFVDEVLARDPEHRDALRMLVRIRAWQHNDELQRSALERLVEAAAAAEVVDEERDALAQLVRLAPDETEFRERLLALGGVPEIIEEVEAFPSAPIAPDSSEVPTFESFMMETQELGTPTSDSPVETAHEFEWNATDTSEATALPENGSVSFADLNEFTDVTAASTSSATSENPATGTSEMGFDIALNSSGQSIAESERNGESLETVSADRVAALLAQELESVDFYLAQGYTDIARDTLYMLERQYGKHAQLEERRRRLQDGAHTTAAAAEATTEPVDSSPSSQLDAPTIEMSDFARYDVAAETVVHAGAPLASETVIAETVSTDVNGASSPLPKIDPGLAAIFDEFRIAVEEEEPQSTADYETHYNLGLAYKEMDLHDEAIEEFQKAAAMVAPQDGTPRYLQCCNLLGHCFMSQGMPSVAAMWFHKGLDAPGHTEDEYQALRYELATAYEGMGDIDRATKTFMEVYGIDVSYRGVSDKLRELRGKAEVRG